MSGQAKAQNAMQLDDDDSNENKQVNINATQVPDFYMDFSRYQGTVNPKTVQNLKRQFELDPNICLIKTLAPQDKKNDDSFSSKEENELQDLTQTTIKTQFLMNRFNVKDQSYLGTAITKDSLDSYFYNMNKRTIIAKHFKDQSDSYQVEKDSFVNWSKYNQILNHLNEVKQVKNFDFKELSKKYEPKEDLEDGYVLNSDGEKVQKVHKKKSLLPWQKEINLLNQTVINDMYQKLSKKDEEQMEIEEKFRLNKTFDFGRDQIYQQKKNNETNQEKYQEDIFSKLPQDIDTIHQYLVEYIDLTGEANRQPQNLVELKEEIKSPLGLCDIQNNTQYFNIEFVNAIYKDYIETFSTVFERENKIQISLSNCQKEISPISRQIILLEQNARIENQDQIEMIKDFENQINLEEIRDEDIFNIVSGRVDQQGLLQLVQQFEQYQSKSSKYKLIEVNENAKIETEKMLNQIRAKFIKKGKEDKDSQACFFNKEEKTIQIQKDKSDPDSDNVSVCSYLNKSQRSQDKNQKGGCTPSSSTRVSIVGFNSRKQSASLTPIKKAESIRKSIVQGLNPRNSITNRSSISPGFNNRKSSSQLSNSQSFQNQTQIRKDSQAQKFEREELASVQSLDSEIKEQQEDTDENAQQNEEYNKMISELDAIETEHNQLLKAIISVQISPKINPILKEIKDLRVLKKYILNSQDINEAIQLTKELNSQICSKLKEVITVLFDDQSVSFEQGLENLMQSLNKINKKENTIDQAKLKIIFSLLNQFRISLEDNKFDINSIQKQNNDPDYQFKKIQEALDKYQNKKNMTQSERSKIESQNKLLDFSKISFYNYKKKKTLNNSSISSSSSSSQLSSVNNLTKDNSKKVLKNKKVESKKEQVNNKTDQTAKDNMNFSFEKYINQCTAPRVKIGLEATSSLASLNTGANTHKSNSTASKTFSLLKVKSFTSLAKSPSNFSQISTLSPLPLNQDSPFLKPDLEQIHELDLNAKQSEVTVQIQQKQPNSPKKNLWNQAKANILKNLEASQQNNNPEKKKNVTFTWQQLIKEQKLKQQQQQESQDKNEINLQNKKQKVLQVIQNHEQIITDTLNSSRNNSSSRKDLSYQKEIKSVSSLDQRKQHSKPFLSAKKPLVNNFSPVGRVVSTNQNAAFQTPLRNNTILKEVQSESKLLNKSSSIFEYKAKENRKTFMDMTRKDLYTRSQKSVDKVEKYFEKFISKSKEITA
ncbi:hypothetical protein TTHERM_00827150 (macronuclear) [Tetrahymena thermophila SB210]|uniref:Uncharacterized protein n=1 Tax=Tetrahymena thermophila (strain SB210) TaxID=312017 RepID=Q22EF4_TETTS|nr:hypothetical protein TTHERM_00827150 [Tetrahymena thermophila SB210]EAR83698.1 hypothetical protein TTHERM_00827150 [Tetrahymena thermophila SB210]|eukprot:XP_001031361.1 hypothetical protein TTHERM_00827150 [Tetrahymena thermophila SB210]